VDFVKSDGGAKDLARVLRIPGTFNRKPEYGPDFPEVAVARVTWDNCYHLAELTAPLPPVEDKKSPRAQKHGPPATGDDGRLLDLARNAKNGAKFTALFDRGDFGGYKSQSEADAALCAMLTFWTKGDEGRADRLFRQSALFRPEKWDSVRVKGATYGTATLARVAQ